LLFKRQNLEKPYNEEEPVTSLRILKDMGFNDALIDKLASCHKVSLKILTVKGIIGDVKDIERRQKL
jgi:hypothetical protein